MNRFPSESLENQFLFGYGQQDIEQKEYMTVSSPTTMMPFYYQGRVEKQKLDLKQSSPENRRKRKEWTDEESSFLRMLVMDESRVTIQWTVIADELNRGVGTRRNGKQCREEWLNRLRPNIKKGNWTAEEEATIEVLVARYGNQWAWFSCCKLPHRAERDIKNKWYSMRRSKQNAERRLEKLKMAKRDEALQVLAGAVTAVHPHPSYPLPSTDYHPRPQIPPAPIDTSALRFYESEFSTVPSTSGGSWEFDDAVTGQDFQI